jgi:hypothetical protein
VPRIVYTAVSGPRSGAISLMHDGGGDRSDTVAALPRIAVAIRRHGNRLVTVSQRGGDDPPRSDPERDPGVSGAASCPASSCGPGGPRIDADRCPTRL